VSDFPHRGCLYWVRIPGEPGRKKRPGLVISIDARNRLASDVLVIPCSTSNRLAPTHVRLGKGQGGLARRSVLKCEQITTIPKDYLVASALGGPLPGRVLQQVEIGVLRAIGIPIGI
jgi:mRNA-degrading endonuclease toxin of MazEF toxin-antitoxin module